MRTPTAVFVCLTVLLGGCEPAPPEPLALRLDVVPEAVPADSVTGEPFLAATPDGVALSWIERTTEGHAFRFARYEAGAWSAPSTIAAGQGWFVNWADVPSILLDGDSVWAHWLEYNGEGRYSYGVRIAESMDGGASFGPAQWLHDDRAAAEHGFVAMAPAPGGPQAIWLDGRKWAEGVEEMTVRARQLTSADGSGMGPEQVIDGRVCDCCPNAVASLGDRGLIAAYRNRTEDEVRDIHVVRMVDGVWTDPRPIHDDGWAINACPVNGPALATDGRRVAIAWFTAPEGDPRVNLAFSDDWGETFGDPIRMDAGGAIGRVDAVLLEDGTAVVSWIRASGGQSSQDVAGILARRAAPDGRLSEPVTVLPVSASRASGYPRMERVGDRLVFAWTSVTPERRVMRGITTIGV